MIIIIVFIIGIVLFLNGRFQWLTGFLEYLRKWKDSTEQRPGNLTQSARSKMFISWQTYEGFQITVNAVIDTCKFLLHKGMEYVLTELFFKDPVEEYFGSQRKLGRRNATQRSAHLDTLTIPFVSKGQYVAKMETHKEDKINAGHESK